MKLLNSYVRTLKLDGSEIYFHILSNTKITINNPRDSYHKSFSNLMPINLDLLFLKDMKKFTYHKHLDEDYTFDLINVTFKWDLRIDKKGKQIKNPKIKDDDKRVAKYISRVQIRDELYVNGFEVNGIKYLRYKRSSGSARVGHCLFIKESLKQMMDDWSNAGLDPKAHTGDIVSFEAYKGLSLSSLSNLILLKPKNILFVKDFKATLKNEEVARVYFDDRKNKLEVKKDKCDIENKIWDGEGLLDSSIFDQIKNEATNFEYRTDKGMLLLRNRFFKSCAFNTNLQDWFKENSITDVNQLKGVTLAEKVEDIKLVVTESSLKYLKLLDGKLNKENIQKWCDQISDSNGYSVFGIVKTDKPTHFFYGDMVETSNSLLNTLKFSNIADTRKLLALNIDYINKIRDIANSPEYLYLYLKGEMGELDDLSNEEEEEENKEVEDSEIAERVFSDSIYKCKKIVAAKLLEANKDFVKTDFFRYFVYQNIIGSLAMKLHNGRVLVHGTNATLFGNPYELLLNIVNKFDGKSHFLHKDEICSVFFENKTNLVGNRSPHVLMGNVLCAKNIRDKDIEKWFNLTREIVIVDAIENNIQQRLNGADYDSDSILLTDNEEIYESAYKDYSSFLVPYADLEQFDKTFDKKSDDEETNRLLILSEIDNQIANNRIGVISNTAQKLVSFYWDKNTRTDLDDIYLKICKLAVLCGVEIDSAKRSFKCSSEGELEEYTELFKALTSDNKEKQEPLFFYLKNNYSNTKLDDFQTYIKNNESKAFKTTPDLISIKVATYSLDETRITSPIKISEMIEKGKKAGGSQYKQIKKAYDALKRISKYISDQYAKVESDKGDKAKKFKYDTAELKILIAKEVKKLKHTLNKKEIARLTLIHIEDMYENDKQMKKRGHKSLLIFLLLYIYYLINGDDAFTRLFNSNNPIPRLRRVEYNKKIEYKLFDKYCYEIA